MAKRVKVPPKQKPKPFTKAEIEQIEQGFRSDRKTQDLYEPTEEQKELLKKAIFGKNERLILTKHCLYIYTITEEYS